MKLAIISVVISLLSMAECDECGPSEFWTKHGCKKCFCSGVSSKCHGSSYSKEKIEGNLDDVYGDLKIFNESATHGDITVGPKRQFPKGLKYFNFRWVFPENFYGNKLRSYGGNISVTEHIKAPPFTIDDTRVRVNLLGDKIRLYQWVDATSLSESTLLYDIYLEEGGWQVTTRDFAMATRDDMMRTLRTLREIEFDAPELRDIEAVSIEELSMDTAVDAKSNLDFLHTNSIEICECPEGYSGDSCETCSCGYYRDYEKESESVFGACIHCPCHHNDTSCKIENCAPYPFEWNVSLLLDCDMD